jgi:hypothetical protein
MNTSELRKYIEEAMQEVSSEKQRRWACAQTGDGFKGDKKLTDKEAKEMCSAPIEERDRARKSTGQYQDMRIKAKEMLWAYFDEELGAMDARASKRIGNKPSDNLVDEIFNAIMDSVPAEVPDNVKRARKAAEEKRKFADIEKMGIYNLENPSITAKTHKRIKPQPKKRSRFPWGGLGENTMKMTTASLKQMIKEELEMDDRVALRMFEEAIASIDATALKNLTAAIDSLAENHGYTVGDVVDVLQANEGSGVSIAMRGDEEVSTRDIAEDQELEECGYSEEGEEEPRRYFEI